MALFEGRLSECSRTTGLASWANREDAAGIHGHRIAEVKRLGVSGHGEFPAIKLGGQVAALVADREVLDDETAVGANQVDFQPGIVHLPADRAPAVAEDDRRLQEFG